MIVRWLVETSGFGRSRRFFVNHTRRFPERKTVPDHPIQLWRCLMKYRITAWINLVVLAVLLSACASPAATPTPQSPVSTSDSNALPSPAPFPLLVTDDLGRKVMVAAMPKRIVSLAPSNTEILFAVGAGDQVVGLTQYCNYPPEASTRRALIGGFSANSISIEKILTLQPDLVVSAGSSHRTVIEALEQINVPVLALDAQNLDGIYKNILMVGQVTGHDTQAQTLVDQMKQRVAAVSDKVKTTPAQERPRVFYEVWDEPLMTAGSATFVHQVIELAGGVNIFADVKEQYPKVSPEVVVARDPDVILGPLTHSNALVASKIAARPGWQPIKAVQKGRIAIVDGDVISRAGPRIVDAIEIVAKLLHPDRFKP